MEWLIEQPPVCTNPNIASGSVFGGQVNRDKLAPNKHRKSKKPPEMVVFIEWRGADLNWQARPRAYESMNRSVCIESKVYLGAISFLLFIEFLGLAPE